MRERDKVLSAVSYLLFRKGMMEEYGINRELKWQTGRYGKPYLPDLPRIFFNISHCESCALCAVSDSEVGADVQDSRGISEDIAETVCSAAELAMLREAPDKELMLRKIWALKEAYLKYIGVGLNHDLKQLDFSELADGYILFSKYGGCFTCTENERYDIAVCSKKFFSDTEIRYVGIEELLKG